MRGPETIGVLGHSIGEGPLDPAQREWGGKEKNIFNVLLSHSVPRHTVSHLPFVSHSGECETKGSQLAENGSQLAARHGSEVHLKKQFHPSPPPPHWAHEYWDGSITNPLGCQFCPSRQPLNALLHCLLPL